MNSDQSKNTFIQFEDLHMGQIIEKEINRVGMTKAEFGRRINTSRQNVNTILKKKDISTDLLKAICKVLNRNFFEVLSFKNVPDSLPYDSLQVTGMELTVKLKGTDMIDFLSWLSSRKSGS